MREFMFGENPFVGNYGSFLRYGPVADPMPEHWPPIIGWPWPRPRWPRLGGNVDPMPEFRDLVSKDVIAKIRIQQMDIAIGQIDAEIADLNRQKEIIQDVKKALVRSYKEPKKEKATRKKRG